MSARSKPCTGADQSSQAEGRRRPRDLVTQSRQSTSHPTGSSSGPSREPGQSGALRPLRALPRSGRHRLPFRRGAFREDQGDTCVAGGGGQAEGHLFPRPDGLISPQDEQVIAHGSVDILELDRVELEIASRGDVEMSTLRDCRPVPSQRPEPRVCEAEEFIGPSSFAVLFSLVCEGIRKMTTYHTQAGGR